MVAGATRDRTLVCSAEDNLMKVPRQAVQCLNIWRLARHRTLVRRATILPTYGR